MVWDPAPNRLVVKVAVVPLIVPVPIEAVPFWNVSVPVGPLEILAVKVTDLP
jgi:hypothetical protein